jgi:hypothetical protein
LPRLREELERVEKRVTLIGALQFRYNVVVGTKARVVCHIG